MKYRLSKKQIYSHLPKPFYFITTCDMAEFSPEKVRESLLDLKNCGFNGFIFFNKPPKGFNKENYLSEDWFYMVKLFAIEAKKLKLEMWINDGFNYPPGNVGGQLQDLDDSLPQRHLVLVDGKAEVKVATWGYPAFEIPRSGLLFNQLVHEKYKKFVGEFFGNPIKGFFTDGDNRRVHPSAMFPEDDESKNYFPYAEDFPETFKNVYGYDITPFLKDILERQDIPQAADYWEHCGKRYQDWFRNNARWLKDNNLLYGGHTGDTAPYLYKDAPRCSAFTEGRFSDLESIFDYPGTDQELNALDGGKHMVIHNWYSPKAIWGNELHTPKMDRYNDISQDMRAKQVGSTGFIYNKKEVLCEMFAASNFDVSPDELKQIAAFQIMQGVTFIIEHAFHYRFFDEVKYFAPPEFSSRGMIGNYVSELNHELGAITYMMAKGKSVCPIALIDPTEAAWRNNIRSDEYFAAFAALNRMPYGYAICDIDRIVNGNFGFKAAVIAGFNPDKNQIKKLKAKGVMVIYGNELDKLKSIVKCDVSYSGEGTPHFVRKIIDNEEFTFISNIENSGVIRGKISAYGKTKDIELYQGDIKYISAKYDDIDDIKVRGEKVFSLPDEATVRFFDDNMLCLERFEYGGDAVVKTENTPSLAFPFESTEEISGSTLYLPEDCAAVSHVVFDDIELNGFSTNVYDDKYRAFKLPVITVGKHSLVINRTEPFRFFDRIFVSGDFDATIASDKTEYKVAFSIYNLTTYIPKNAAVVLSKRRTALKTDCSWALQGQPFYSGKAEYCFTADLPENGEYRLVLPRVRDVAWVEIDKKKIGKVIKPPYEFAFKHKKGSALVKITVANSLGNSFECFLDESGILKGGYIEKM